MDAEPIAHDPRCAVSVVEREALSEWSTVAFNGVVARE
jgi:hypothetical protein